MSRYDAKARCDAKSVSCEVSRVARWCLVVPVAGCSLNGMGAYKASRLATSPCPVEYFCIPGCSDISSVVPVELKRPSACVRSCRSMACWKTRPNCPCGRGSIVVCSSRLWACRRSFRLQRCRCGKAQGVLFPVGEFASKR